MAPIEVAFVSGLLLVIILLLVVPALIYYLSLYYRHRLDPSIKKRHYGLVMAMDILLIISLIGDKSLYMISIIITDTLEEAQSHIIYKLSDYIYFVAGPTITFNFLTLTWAVYYDIKWAIITSEGNKWTHFIDPQYHATQTDFLNFANNWFIMKRPTLGNTKWITKYITLPICIIMLSTVFLSWFLYPGLHYFVFLLYLGLIFIMVLIVYCNIPTQQIDVFRIKSHTDKLLLVALSFVICFALYVFFKTFVTAEQYQYIIIFVGQYIFTAHYFIGGIMVTRYVLKECKLLTKRPTFVRLGYDSTKQNTKSNVKLSLQKILSTKVSFNAFMSHLIKEFSSENLLCILECYQFKAMVWNTNNVSTNNVELSIDNALMRNETLRDYTLPLDDDDMPRSAIVYDETLTMEEKALKLIEKYVFSYRAGACIFEVNISSASKYNTIQKSHQLKKSTVIEEAPFSMQQFYELFDAILKELFQLLNDSRSRFVNTDDYKQLIKHEIV